MKTTTKKTKVGTIGTPIKKREKSVALTTVRNKKLAILKI